MADTQTHKMAQNAGGCNGTQSAAERSHLTSEVRGGSWEELPHAQGQGRRPRVPGCDGTGMAKRSYATSK